MKYMRRAAEAWILGVLGLLPHAGHAAFVPLVLTSSDGRSLEVIRSRGAEPGRIPVLDRCGDPAVGEARIREVRSERGAIVAIYGKHCSAALSLDTMVLECRGCD